MQASFPKQFSDSLVSMGPAQGFDALFNGREPNLLVRLDGLCTGAIHCVVGQHQMGQADQMQVGKVKRIEKHPRLHPRWDLELTDHRRRPIGQLSISRPALALGLVQVQSQGHH